MAELRKQTAVRLAREKRKRAAAEAKRLEAEAAALEDEELEKEGRDQEFEAKQRARMKHLRREAAARRAKWQAKGQKVSRCSHFIVYNCQGFVIF